MKIPVQRINAGVNEFQEFVSPAFIDSEYQPFFNNNLDVRVYAEKIGRNYKNEREFK